MYKRHGKIRIYDLISHVSQMAAAITICQSSAHVT